LRKLINVYSYVTLYLNSGVPKKSVHTGNSQMKPVEWLYFFAAVQVCFHILPNYSKLPPYLQICSIK